MFWSNLIGLNKRWKFDLWQWWNVWRVTNHVYCLLWWKSIKSNLTAVKKHKHKTWLNRKCSSVIWYYFREKAHAINSTRSCEHSLSVLINFSQFYYEPAMTSFFLPRTWFIHYRWLLGFNLLSDCIGKF